MGNETGRRGRLQVFDQGCDDCGEGRDHCHGTLVLHADQTAECDEQARCGATEARHRWWVTCSELGCGCTGDEVMPEVAAALALAA